MILLLQMLVLLLLWMAFGDLLKCYRISFENHEFIIILFVPLNAAKCFNDLSICYSNYIKVASQYNILYNYCCLTMSSVLNRKLECSSYYIQVHITQRSLIEINRQTKDEQQKKLKIEITIWTFRCCLLYSLIWLYIHYNVNVYFWYHSIGIRSFTLSVSYYNFDLIFFLFFFFFAFWWVRALT